MQKLAFWIAALAAGPLFAQSLVGTWQGTLQAPNRELRTVIKVSTTDAGGLKAIMYSIDQGPGAVPSSAVTLQSANVKVEFPGVGVVYEGKLSADGNSITGTWTQGPKPLSLILTRANGETAWAIPEPPPRPKPMAADADPAFEVATIKPSKPDVVGRNVRVQGRTFSTLNYTLRDLITFAWELHPRQVANGPAWVETDKYDLMAKPDGEGLPSDKQWKTMVQKLVADRFHLSFHREKRELSVYALTVAKTGARLTKSEGDPNGLPGLGFRGLGDMLARNATMADVARALQSGVLDRPVVDQTGISGRFDFSLRWAPDEFQFTDVRGQISPPADAEQFPDLFTAIQQQLGLKLDSTKAPVEVLAIDHVERPSEN